MPVSGIANFYVPPSQPARPAQSTIQAAQQTASQNVGSFRQNLNQALAPAPSEAEANITAAQIAGRAGVASARHAPMIGSHAQRAINMPARFMPIRRAPAQGAAAVQNLTSVQNVAPVQSTAPAVATPTQPPG